MHTVETVQTESHPLAARFRFLRSEDTTIATLAAWSFGLAIFTLAGFYFGTIAGHDNHPEGRHKDLDPTQLGLEPLWPLHGAMPYALGGLIIGLLFALFISFKYVPDKLRELEHEQGGH